MFDRQTEDITIGLSPDRSHSSGICQETNFAEIRTIAETRGYIASAQNNVDNALLDKVHFGADRTLFDYYVA